MVPSRRVAPSRRASLLLLALVLAAPALRGESGGVVHFTLTGEVEWDRLGYSLAGLGDVSGDEIGDLAVGVPEWRPDEEATGKVLVVSGASGAVIRELRSEEPGVQYGRRIASGGDFDGDGRDDLLIMGTARIEVRSAATGALLLVNRNNSYTSHLPRLCGVPDVDGDGADEFVIAMPRETDWDAFGWPTITRGRVRLHSGRTGEEMWTTWGEEVDQHLGNSVAAVGDVDGDGTADLVAGAGGNDGDPRGRVVPGRVLLLSGRDGREIYRLDACPDCVAWGERSRRSGTSTATAWGTSPPRRPARPSAASRARGASPSTAAAAGGASGR